MNTYILLIISFLLLLSYFFELTSQKTKIPTVLLLIVLGWALKQLVFFFNIINIPSVDYLVEGVGTIGLIFIVFEATIDLKFTKEKLPIFTKSILFSFLSILIFSILFAVLLKNVNF